MIIYIEKEIKDYKRVKEIVEKFKNSTIIFIDNYKNIFSKNLPANANKNSFILAKLKTISILDAPDGYGHNNKTSYFLKTSLNCVFSCSYCYLKGAFKNEIPVYFLNYDDIKNEIIDKINSFKNAPLNKGSCPKDGGVIFSDKDYKNKIWFYSGDYSDILGMEKIGEFIKEFVPFFEGNHPLAPSLLRKGEVMMEIRTKSSNIKPILDLGFVPKNTEFAFSLNPEELIKKYEKGTSSLESRIKAINTLLSKGYKVGLRFLPLLPVKNYEEIYTEFIKYIKNKIDMDKVSSTFVSGLLYTKKDYNTMLKKYPKLDVLYRLQEEKDGFIRETREMRTFFYNLFKSLDEKCFICLDEK